MTQSVEEFHTEFFQDVHAQADAKGIYAEDAFFEWFTERLVDAGELETADRAPYGARGLRVDGYGGDPLQAENVLSLIVADFHQADAITTLTSTDLDAIFKRLSNFLAKSLEPGFRDSIEESTPAFGLVDLIGARWDSISKVRLFLVTNRLLSTRVDGRPEGQIGGVPVTFSVWDIGRLFRVAASASGREELDIDLVRDFGGAIPVLPAHLDGTDYEAYLAVVPGEQLAAIYDRWGARLLEQNVRVFLQARGGVNKGIRNTIDNEPEMFFAFNNGLTATATEVVLERDREGLAITRLKNLQIVNGGQTTASIHQASLKKGATVGEVFVQMKLSIIDPSRAESVVPRISEYANTQNRVNAADFFANHPYHVRMQQFSRRIFAPSPDGTFRQSKWFYERARGQYQDERGRLGKSDLTRFDMEHPKAQVFTKTDLAKFLGVWMGIPHVVSRGAQKNFAEFAKTVGKQWEDDADQFNEQYYQHAIAKAIVFREVEALVPKQEWYQGGYRANIVAYTIAKLAHEVQTKGFAFDFDRVWREQALTPRLRQTLTDIAESVHDVIVTPPSGVRNVTEWAKQEACWNRVKELGISLSQELLEELPTKSEVSHAKRLAKKAQQVDNGIEAQKAIFDVGANEWREVIAWGNERKLLNETDSSILSVAAAIPNKIPTERQCLRIVEMMRRLRTEGCTLASGVG